MQGGPCSWPHCPSGLFCHRLCRYADLVAHAQLKAHLVGAGLPYRAADVLGINAEASSDRVRALGQAERLQDSYWVTE